jgi:DNA-directed RNA polymerase omega subunit
MNQSPNAGKGAVVASLEQLLPKMGGNVFCLVRLAMIRARELNGGSASLLTSQYLSSDKPTIIALEEMARGKIGYTRKKGKS